MTSTRRRPRACVLGSAAFLLGMAGAALGHDYQAGAIAILHPHARPTAPSQPTGGGYLTLVNKGPDDRLIGASTPAAASVELHSMRMDGDVMRMREIGAIDVPAGQRVELKPGGLHLMLVGLKQPLVAGQSLPLKLRFEKAGEVAVELNVDAPGAAAAGSSAPQSTHDGHAMPPGMAHDDHAMPQGMAHDPAHGTAQDKAQDKAH